MGYTINELDMAGNVVKTTPSPDGMRARKLAEKRAAALRANKQHHGIRALTVVNPTGDVMVTLKVGA